MMGLGRSFAIFFFFISFIGYHGMNLGKWEFGAGIRNRHALLGD